MADIAARQDPGSLIFGCYDLTRNRIFSPGDELLFRPLLYGILGVEQVVFGHNFWAWQLFGLLAHLLVMWVLLRFLWRLAGPWLAFAGTWLFSLSWVICDMVTWSHLTSYLLMLAALVAAIEQAYLCIEEGRLPWDRLLKITACFLCACFIYESANLFAMWLMLVLMMACPRAGRRAWVVVVPVILYAMASAYNFIVVNHLQLPSGHSEISWTTAANFIRTISWWTYVGIFNDAYHYVFSASRAIFVEKEVFVFKPLVWIHLVSLCGLIVAGTFLSLVAMDRRGSARPRFFAVLLVAGMLCIFVGMLVLGRQSMPFVNIVRINTYYQYIFWLFMVMAGFLLIGDQACCGFRRKLVILFVSGCILSGALQGGRILLQESAYASLIQFRFVLTKFLDNLIQKEGKKPGFSIYVSPEFPGNYKLLNIFTRPDRAPMDFTYTNMLYWPYIRSIEKAEYKLLFVDKETFLFCVKDNCVPAIKAMADAL